MIELVESQVSLVPILLWVLALVFAGVAIWRGERPLTRSFVIDRLLRYLFLFPLGIQGLWAFFGQVFLPEDTANAIGWEPSPFQFEVGLANLGLGFASLYAAFSGFQARAAIAISAGCFLAGAGVGHLLDIAQGDNLNAGNAGPILYTDFLTPIAVLVLLLLVPRQAQKAAQAPTRAEPATVKDEPRAKLEAALAKVGEKNPTPPAATPSPAPTASPSPLRLEDELETARKSMRDALRAGPRPELLEPPKPTDRPRKSPRRGKHLPEDQD